MDVPLSMLILLCLIFFVIGSVFMLLLQYYVYLKFSLLPEESAEQKDINARYSLPSAIHQTARSLNISTSGSAAATATPASAAQSLANVQVKEADTTSLVALNFVMQFLFHELKNSNRVRKWFYRKLSLELDELIAKTTTGKLFDKLTIKQLELGDQFPEIRTLRLHSVELDESGGRIENLDLLLEIHYMGNFRTSIDADMVLGKKGSLTLKVKQLSGCARLQFTRNPYTHWSLSFLGDPELDLAVESRYQGRQMQSNITSLISNQIRKAVRRKHTLPNYKLRYKPFFYKNPDEEAGEGDIQPNGVLEVKVSEISRLMCPQHLTDIYCTMTMASLAFVEAHQRDDRNVFVSLDVEIHKAKNQQIGIVFRQAAADCVEIDAVLPNTPACKSNLMSGDVLSAIEGRRVTTIQQVAKVVKGLQSGVFSLRIGRVIPGIIRNDAILEDLELYEELSDMRTSYGSSPSKAIEADVSVRQVLLRNNSGEKGTSSESSLGSTPTNSPKRTKLIAKALKKTISRDSCEQPKDEEAKSKLKLPSKVEERPRTPTSSNGGGANDVEHYYQHSTVDCKHSRLMSMEDVSNFRMDARSRFLNICVYGKCPGESQLLGYVNISISQVLAECCETSLSQCFKSFELNPPIPQDLKTHHLSTQSGFNANLCFGDILLAFTWDGNPNLANETPSKQSAKSKSRTSTSLDKTEDSGYAETISVKSTDSIASSTMSAQPRAHSFVRTHFQRATQCEFCGRKIWLKDGVQCRECSMCCHKKCINKCQNATVCGPVDCSAALQQTVTLTATPEFLVTEADAAEVALDADLDGTIIVASDEVKSPTTTANLEVHRPSLSGLLAQGMKRVNSANNLAIPGLVSSMTGGGTSLGGGVGSGSTLGLNMMAKSLPPTPQHTPSRKSSLVCPTPNSFDLVTQCLEAIPAEVNVLSSEQINSITEHVTALSREEDVMTLAKAAGKNLYSDLNGNDRVDKINLLLSKLRLALDSETASHSTLTVSMRTDPGSDTATPEQTSLPSRENVLGKSEERIQALSVIMLYLCTGLQHAQGVALH